MLLIDGDIVAFKAAAASEVEIAFNPKDFIAGDYMLMTNLDEAVERATSRIESIKKKLNTEDVLICFTGSTNWRNSILETYKANRSGVRKPMFLKEVREALSHRYKTKTVEGLEADDLMGIMATSPRYLSDFQKIIVSEDKDLRTIPAYVYNPDKDLEPTLVSKEDADKWHLIQCLSGDVTDGYEGCPSVGLTTASKYINEGLKVVPYEHTFSRGPRKGQTEIRYKDEPCDDLWAITVSLYEKNGLSEEQALIQAQVARILRYSDWDAVNKEVIPWKPQPQ